MLRGQGAPEGGEDALSPPVQLLFVLLTFGRDLGRFPTLPPVVFGRHWRRLP